MTTGIVLWVRIGNLVSNPYGDGERGSDYQEGRETERVCVRAEEFIGLENITYIANAP